MNKLVKGIKNPRKVGGFAKYKFNKIAGKILYKNEHTLEANQVAKKTLKFVTQGDPLAIKNKEDSEQAVHFKKHGAVKLGIIYPEELINSIKSKYDKLIEDDNYSLQCQTFEGQVFTRMINQAWVQFPEVKELITPELKKLLEEYHGNFQVKHVGISRNYSIPQSLVEKKHAAANWHNDDQADWYDENGNQIAVSKIFINISDVTDKDGPLHLNPKDRSVELIKSGFKNRFNWNVSQEVLEDKKYLVKSTGKKGSAMWGTMRYCLHRAGIPEQGHQRDMIIIQIESSKEPLKENWPENCINLGFERVLHENKLN